ncbi:MAG: hypothetical protein IH936_10140 [Acidobacteria bacterium]|nr:hypothetical protein [Acidobacteriota bacterium]
MIEPASIFKRASIAVARRALAALAALLLFGLGAPGPAAGQSIPPAGSKPLPYLLNLGDIFALVRYSPGALDRASHVQQRFALLAEDFRKWSKQSVPLSAVLLSRTDWEALDLAVPYGLPAHMANGEVALCAWGDHGTVRLWRALLGGELPQLEGHPLYGSKAEASSLLLNDLLAQGVAARALLNQAGFGGVHPDIVNFTAHVIALAASNLHESLSLGAIRRIYSMTAPDASLGVPSGDGIWRARLASERPYYEAAAALISKRGATKAPKALLKLLRRDGVLLTTRAVADKFPEVRGLLPLSGSRAR